MRNRAAESGLTEVPFLRQPIVYLVGVLTGLTLGLNWPVMSFGVGVIPPLWFAVARLAGGGLALGLALAPLRKLRAPQRRDLPVMATVMILRLGVVTTFVFMALRFTPPGRSSVLVYTSVLWAAPLARWLLGERVPPLRRMGVAVGVVGVVVLVSPWNLNWSDGDLIIGYGLLLAAAVAQALGAVHVRGHTWALSPLSIMPWLLGGTALGLAPIAYLVEGAPTTIELGWGAILALLYQALFASAFGFWGVLTVTRTLPAVSSQLILMSAPAFGVLSSILLMDERLDLSLMLGMLLIFAGVATGIVSSRGAGRQTAVSPGD